MTHTLTLQKKTQLTPDVHAFSFDRPDSFAFTPGHATEMSLELPGWEKEGRPFTFTSLPDENRVEFVIKSYPSHDGVTEQLGALQPGQQVEIEEPFGALEDKGPGTFIAAGAGLTPFLAILRQRAAKGTLDGCRLIYTNKTPDDIILREELAGMQGLETHFTVTDETAADVETAMIDKAWLADRIGDVASERFYLCGPPGFVDEMREALLALGAEGERILTEEGW